MPTKPIQLDAFTRAFFEAALWSSIAYCDDDGRPYDQDEGDNDDRSFQDHNYTRGNIDPHVVRALAAECVSFQEEFGAAIDAAETDHSPAALEGGNRARVGHDLWLTRNGHGAGFWDGRWPEPLATILDEAADRLGEVCLYMGDDEVIYASGYEEPDRVIEVSEPWLCVDCLMVAVNDDTSGIEDEARIEAIYQGLADLVTHEGSHLAPNFDSETGEGRDEFSRRGCDCCGSHLAGEFHRFAVLAPNPEYVPEPTYETNEGAGA